MKSPCSALWALLALLAVAIGVPVVQWGQGGVPLSWRASTSDGVGRKLTKAINPAEIRGCASISAASQGVCEKSSSWSNSFRLMGAAVSTITVSTTGELVAALKGASVGDQILLKGGDYGGLYLRNVEVAEGVSITSANPGDMAKFTGIQIHGSSGLNFSHIEVVATPDSQAAGAVGVFNSKSIHFDSISVHGSMDGNPQNDTDGFRVKESADVSVTNSEFQQLRIAITHVDNESLKFTGNNIHDIRMDGIRGGGGQNVQILNNVFKDFYPFDKDHGDAIQFYYGSRTPYSNDVLIDGNVVIQGDGGKIQGIFLRSATEKLFNDVVISNNLVIGGNYNGIMVEGGVNVRVVDNKVVSLDNDTNWIRMESVEGAVVSGNSAKKFLFDDEATVTDSGNDNADPVYDQGAGALKTWLEQHSNLLKVLPADLLTAVGDLLPPTDEISSPGKGLPVQEVTDEIPPSLPDVPSLISSKVSVTLDAGVKQLTLLGSANVNGVGNAEDNLIIGNAGDNSIIGGAGDDIIEGGLGRDVIDGGEGRDTASYAGANSAVTVSLIRWNGESSATAFQDTVGSGYHKLINFENVIGSAFDDHITGDNGANVLTGGAGDDWLGGRDGADSMFGGAGADTYVFSAVTDSRVEPAGRDVIFDFNSSEGDKIRLSTIDAIEGTDRNDVFKFVADFTKVAGQLISVQTDDHYVVQGDTNGDGAADFAIVVYANKALTATDFLL